MTKKIVAIMFCLLSANITLAAELSSMERYFINLVPRPQMPQDHPYAIRDVEIPGGAKNITLSGELTQPLGAGPFPGVVLVSGSELLDRDSEFLNHKPYLVIADFLTRNGYMVFRHDDRGFGKSTGNAFNATDDDFAADSATALSWLRKQKNVAANKVGFIGHAHGGVKAALAAQRERPDFMVLLGSSVQSVYESLISQQIDLESAELLSESEIKQQSEALKAIFSILRKAENYSQAQQAVIKDIKQKGADEREAQEIANTFATPWFMAELDRDPVTIFKKYTGPVLSLYAENDLLISPKLSTSKIKPLFKHSASKVIVLAGLNHYFQPSSDGLINEMWKIETTFDQSALDAMLNWMKKYNR